MNRKLIKALIEDAIGIAAIFGGGWALLVIGHGMGLQ